MAVFLSEKWKIVWGKKKKIMNTFKFGTRQKKKVIHWKFRELYNAASK